MAKTPEAKVKDAVKKVLNHHKLWWYMPVQTGYGVAGIPDFVCCWHGRFVGIETKAPGKENNLSKHQQVQRAAILEAGGLYAVISSGEQMEQQLQQWERLHNGYEKAEGEVSEP